MYIPLLFSHPFRLDSLSCGTTMTRPSRELEAARLSAVHYTYPSFRAWDRTLDVAFKERKKVITTD